MKKPLNPHRVKAHKLWPDALWIQGAGRFASVSHCGGVTVILCDSREKAESTKRAIDRHACGGRCVGATGHVIVDLDHA